MGFKTGAQHAGASLYSTVVRRSPRAAPGLCVGCMYVYVGSLSCASVGLSCIDTPCPAGLGFGVLACMLHPYALLSVRLSVHVTRHELRTFHAEYTCTQGATSLAFRVFWGEHNVHMEDLVTGLLISDIVTEHGTHSKSKHSHTFP